MMKRLLMTIYYILLFILGLMFSGYVFDANAAVEDIYFDAHIMSHHWAEPPYRQYASGKKVYENWNESNQGIGLDVGFHKNLSLVGGYIENSYDIQDWYAGADIHIDRSGNGFGAGVSVVYAPGYENTPSPTSVVAPNVFYQYGPVKIKVSGFPGEYAGLTASWKFK